MAELVDALDLGSSPPNVDGGSSPPSRTNSKGKPGLLRLLSRHVTAKRVRMLVAPLFCNQKKMLGRMKSPQTDEKGKVLCRLALRMLAV